MNQPKDMSTSELIDEIISVANVKLKKAKIEHQRIKERVEVLEQQVWDLESLRNKVIGS